MHILCIMLFKFLKKNIFNFVGMTIPESTTRCEQTLCPRNRKTSALFFSGIHVSGAYLITGMFML